jgi:hypothetical protein
VATLQHYDRLKDRFPDISANAMSTVVISRDTSSRRGDVSLPRYLSMLREQFNVDEIITYDDLIQKGRTAVAQISGATEAPQ